MWAQLASAGIGAGMGVYQMIQGRKERKEAEKDLSEFEFQELNNAYENIKISTVGSDLMREENARATASGVDALRSGGIRGVLSGVPRLQANNNLQNRQARAYLDNQVQQREYAIAGDDVRIRGMQESRDNAELAGIQNRIAAGKENQMQGLRGIGNSITSGVSALEKGGVIGGGSGESASATRFNPNAMSDLPSLQYGQTLERQTQRGLLNDNAPQYGF